MPTIRGGARSGAAGEGAVGGGKGAPVTAQGRPCRVSAATALASFDWTDDVIVEVGLPTGVWLAFLYDVGGLSRMSCTH